MFRLFLSSCAKWYDIGETNLFQPSMLYDYSDFAQVRFKIDHSETAARESFHGNLCQPQTVASKYIFIIFFVLRRSFSILFCTVSGCEGGNRTHNLAVHTWRFRLLSYVRHPRVNIAPLFLTSLSQGEDVHASRIDKHRFVA
jgi:hypothetical protein